MDDLLDQLQTYVNEHRDRSFFGPAARAADIAAVEEAANLKLPASYKSFLQRFDGGFINICGDGPGDKYWDVGVARWNSNWLFGTKDLIKQHRQACSVGGLDQIGYIPFAQTRGQELLVFAPRADGSEPPVLDAFHETSDWAELYPDFATMLRAYIEGEGDIETIASGYV